MRSESSSPQPLKSASKPSMRSRSARQTARLQERAPSQARLRSLRSGPSGRRSAGSRRLTPPRRRCASQRREPPGLRLQALAQNFFGERARQQHAVAGDEPAGLGEPPMGGDEVRPQDAVAVEEDAVVAARREDRPVADLAGAEAAMLVPGVRERDAEPRLPARDQRGGRRARAVVGDHHLELPVGLARERAQHRVERVRALVGRHDDGDAVAHSLTLAPFFS